MKGYEDLAAGLMLLAVVLIGGYFYLNQQVIDQKKVTPVVNKKVVENTRSEKTMFEVMVKRTE